MIIFKGNLKAMVLEVVAIERKDSHAKKIFQMPST